MMADKMAVVGGGDSVREHEPLSSKLVLFVIFLILFHIGAIVSSSKYIFVEYMLFSIIIMLLCITNQKVHHQ